MRTVTFNTQVHDDVIQIPDSKKDVSIPPRNAKGILRKSKNPALISKEKTAWEMAVKEKYDHRWNGFWCRAGMPLPCSTRYSRISK